MIGNNFQSLSVDASIISTNKCFKLLMQGDGNLVLYYQATGGALWSTSTVNSGSNRAVMQSDRNFVLYNSANQAKWSSGTVGNPGSNLYIQDDGNLVIYNPAFKALWSSGTSAQCPGYFKSLNDFSLHVRQRNILKTIFLSDRFFDKFTWRKWSNHSSIQPSDCIKQQVLPIGHANWW